MRAARSFIVIGLVALTFPVAVVAFAQPVPTAAPRQASSEPTPFPSNIATPAPLFGNKAYFYRGEENDPKAHPVPPEVQSGFKRERIYCMDWSRALRTSHPNDWSYFATTCSCYPQVIYDVIHHSTPAAGSTP